MSINYSSFEKNIQILANNVTVTSNTSDFLNISKAIQFSECGQVENYTNYSSFPIANNRPNTFAVDSSTNSLYFSNGVSWSSIGGGTSVDNSLSNSPTTAISSGVVTSLNNLNLTSLSLLESQSGWNLFSWGRNLGGQLGNGTKTNYSSPIQVGSLTNWKQVACGYIHTATIKTDGTLWTWGQNNDGYNFYGQLGNGTINNYSSPIQIGTLSNWKQVAGGIYYTAAIKTDGTLWTWGYNFYGQLGNGTTANYSSPIQVGSLTNWKQVTCGSNHTTAIKSDGTLWTWGSDAYGQLGNGISAFSYPSPIQVGSLTNWKQVAVGSYHTTAIKSDGTLWTWGSNGGGQLGNGTTTDYSSPIQVGTLTNWKQVSCGSIHTAAIKTDGTLWTWGFNGNGQLGNGTTTSYSSPIQVGSLTNWKQVAGGAAHTAAIKTDGTLWTCGYNSYGQLGNGTNTNYSSPIQVGSLTNWKQVAGGSNHTLSITYPISSGYFPDTSSNI